MSVEFDWPSHSPDAGTTLTLPGAELRIEDAPGAALISGDLDAGIAALTPGAPLLGLGGVAGSGPYAIRMARDRVLLILTAPCTAAPGWHGSYALSPACDGWRCLRLSGPEAETLLSEGTGADLTGGSPGAAVLFAGLTCAIVRQGDDWLIWVERGHDATLWHWFATAR